MKYSRRYGLDAARLRRMPEHAIVMHPGPMNRGMEIDPQRSPTHLAPPSLSR